MTFETFDQRDEETWPDQKRQWQRQRQLRRQRPWQSKNTLKEHSKSLATFETLITFLTIENNNLNIYSYPWIKSDRDSIRNSCDVFNIKTTPIGAHIQGTVSSQSDSQNCSSESLGKFPSLRKPGFHAELGPWPSNSWPHAFKLFNDGT